MGAEEEAALAMVEEFTRYGSYKSKAGCGCLLCCSLSFRGGMEWGLPFVLRAAIVPLSFVLHRLYGAAIN